MSNRAKTARDPFTFSLGGLTTITSFVAAPAIADDRLNQDPADRPSPVREDRGRTGRIWPLRLRRAT